MSRCLSGIQPSGKLHFGNYFGAMVQHIALSNQPESNPHKTLFFIADYHALTSLHNAQTLSENVRAIAAAYVALGLNTDKSSLFRQSDVPEVQELTWLLSCTVGMGLLQRSHSYKEKVEAGITPSVGLFAYPLLMAADILIYGSDVVPIGGDQVSHIEIAQDAAQSFNAAFKGEFLKRPEWKLSENPKIVGVDGRKMSKSYDNTIELFSEGADLKKAVSRITTDSRPPELSKDPETIPLYSILKLFFTKDQQSNYEDKIKAGGSTGPGYGQMKKDLLAEIEAQFAPAREKFKCLMSSDGTAELEEILSAGAVVARGLAKETLARCYDAVGMGQAAARQRK